MITTHQITCAGEDFCPAYSITAYLQATPPAEQAARHRAALAKDGWVDLEGRDYCPDCNPLPAPAP
ncbi:hypothetical protein JTP67_05925 [Streptomyces sp. S12]|uniref:hypothetical protein n=1 Tax=Streptomyces sp. NPDC057115 TaxID=3346022 RepID=UPI0019601D1F|nr:hypothetical protein [Streptomyces sp. S12]